MNSDSIHILIIEDERVIWSGCRLVLMEQGYAVDIRMTGGTGLEAALKGNYDLVLLDIKLPDISGMEILQKIREKRPEVHVIIMTGFSTVQNADQGSNESQRKYVNKLYDVMRMPKFWMTKLKDIKNTDDLKYIWKGMKAYVKDTHNRSK